MGQDADRAVMAVRDLFRALADRLHERDRLEGDPVGEACGVVASEIDNPAYSDAWSAFDLPVPLRHGGWQRGICGGWSCHVEQGRYGHPAKKATWLYAYGTELPTLKWGSRLGQAGGALVSWCGNHVKIGEDRPRVGKHAASRTPLEFRDVLLSIARSAHQPRGAA